MFEKLFARLKPAVFNYKENILDELDTEKAYFGVMAQDILNGLESEGLNPDDFSIVKLEKSGYLSVDYIQLIPILISRIKKLEHEMETLKEKL